LTEFIRNFDWIDDLQEIEIDYEVAKQFIHQDYQDAIECCMYQALENGDHQLTQHLQYLMNLSISDELIEDA
jgi:hypothetical protein